MVPHLVAICQIYVVSKEIKRPLRPLQLVARQPLARCRRPENNYVV
jgi:hypothetical protein